LTTPAKNVQKKLMLVPQADFLKRHKLFFLNFGAAGKILFIISAPHLQNLG
jgi:hypothetical protein